MSPSPELLLAQPQARVQVAPRYGSGQKPERLGARKLPIRFCPGKSTRGLAGGGSAGSTRRHWTRFWTADAPIIRLRIVPEPDPSGAGVSDPDGTGWILVGRVPRPGHSSWMAAWRNGETQKGIPVGSGNVFRMNQLLRAGIPSRTPSSSSPFGNPREVRAMAGCGFFTWMTAGRDPLRRVARDQPCLGSSHPPDRISRDFAPRRTGHPSRGHPEVA